MPTTHEGGRYRVATTLVVVASFVLLALLGAPVLLLVVRGGLSGLALLAAAVVMWARAVSEFGAIVVLTYNPKVVSVLSYDRFTSYGLGAVLPVAAVLVILALVPLVVLRSLKGQIAYGEP
jgi:ABC-type sulfate transport system permease component